jgi:hypothetical protein
MDIQRMHLWVVGPEWGHFAVLGHEGSDLGSVKFRIG